MTEPAIEAADARSLLPTLTGFRWWAALVVFLFHLDGTTGWLFVKPFGFGQAGVAFFFVLSGFVLAWSWRPGTSARRFYWRRFARIYPAYLAAFLVVLAVVLIWPAAPFDHSPLAALGTVTLTQAWMVRDDLVFSFNGPSWSLADEAFFYLCFPALVPLLLRLSGRVRDRVVLGVLAVGLVTTVLLALVGLGRGVAFTNPAVRLPEFVLGIGLALRVRAHPPRWRSLRWPVVVLVVSLPIALVAPLFPLRDYVVLPAAAMLLTVGASRDLAGVRGLLDHQWSVYLGELSFCFYLVHLIVIQLLVEGLWKDVTWTPVTGFLPAAVCLVLSLVAAAGLHHGVELPVQHLLTRHAATGSRRGRIAV